MRRPKEGIKGKEKVRDDEKKGLSLNFNGPIQLSLMKIVTKFMAE
jgi:hypothetical protein